MTRIVVLALSLSGCAAQLTAGRAGTALSSAATTATLAATMQALRANNGVVGARLTMVVSDGLALQQGVIHGGYDMRVVPGRLVLEPGLDLGAGSPVSHRFDGVGAYAGVSGTARVRVFGMNDDVPAFEVIAPIVELVFAPRIGAWMPPEGSNVTSVYTEYAVEFGVRVAFATDLASPEQGYVTDDPPAPLVKR